jgi:hexosaminidase
MNKYLLFLVLLTAEWGYAQHISIIPYPAQVVREQGTCNVTPTFVIDDKVKAFGNEIRVFNASVQEQFAFTFKSSSGKNRSNLIELIEVNQHHPEAYRLIITSSKIRIEGSRTGVFYGLQSLLQLMAGTADTKTNTFALPAVVITDKPAYAWRGMHLDVCRHFFTKEEVMRYLDYLALYKLNTFHWHLTEDQGWRIAITKYPKLTTVGAHRAGTIIGKYAKDAPSDNIPHGGFYTQDDIREVVAYASARHITIVPEIEMPGHALAALSAYPEFSCTGGPFTPAITWGVFDDVFCAGNDAVFSFLEDVLREVIALFPGKFIHVGGDECPKTRWKSCARCQQRIRQENLKDEHELQSYFITRMERFLNSQGRQLIGWDEILEGGLAPYAAVMSWRGESGGIEAARQRHPVVMSPGKPCYFDHYQSADISQEPLAIGGYNPLKEVYAYVPTPALLAADEARYILGAQGNVWTEYMKDFRQVQYMALPRMCALAETLWTPAASKNYSHFIQRLKQHTPLLDKKKVNYARHFLTE